MKHLQPFKDQMKFSWLLFSIYLWIMTSQGIAMLASQPADPPKLSTLLGYGREKSEQEAIQKKESQLTGVVNKLLVKRYNKSYFEAKLGKLSIRPMDEALLRSLCWAYKEGTQYKVVVESLLSPTDGIEKDFLTVLNSWRREKPIQSKRSNLLEVIRSMIQSEQVPSKVLLPTQLKGDSHDMDNIFIKALRWAHSLGVNRQPQSKLASRQRESSLLTDCAGCEVPLQVLAGEKKKNLHTTKQGFYQSNGPLYLLLVGGSCAIGVSILYPEIPQKESEDPKDTKA